MAKDNVTRRISIYVNGAEVENSLKGVEGAMSHVRNKMRLLNKDSETYDQDSKELAQTMDQLKTKQSEYREELGLTNKTMKDSGEIAGGLRGALSGIWASLTSGDLKGAKEGITSIQAGLGGLVKSSLAFLATPLGAGLAALAGLAAGAKALFDYNAGLTELNYKLSSLGVAAEEISKVRSEIQATAETYGKEFEVIAEKANSLAKSYGISMSEANDIIARGLADGGAYNDEFLDSIGEYDEFFAKAGYSAEQFANVINTGYDLGIYSDKLPDALKEADLALKEQTQATKDALVNAFGAAFSDDLLLRVRAGQTTTKQALDEIAAKAAETGLSQQQQAQLTADIFKGAGEDAGGALKVLEAVNQASQKTLGETGGAYEELRAANERLNKEQAKLFEIDGFGDIWAGIKAASINAMASMLEYISDIKESIQPLIDLVGIVFANAWEYLKLTVSTVFDFIGGYLKAFSSSVSTIFGVIGKILTGDFPGALEVLKNGFLSFGTIVSETFGKVKNNIIDALKGIIENVAPFLEAIGFDVEKIQAKLDSFKNKDVELKVKQQKESAAKEDAAQLKKEAAEREKLLQEELRKQADLKADAAKKEADKRKQEADKKKAEEEKAAKDAYQTAKNLADAKAKLAKAQLDQYIFDLKTNIDKDKALTPEIIGIEESRLDTIRNKNKEFNTNELAQKIVDLEAKAILEKTSVELLNAQKEELNIAYNLKNQQLDLDFIAQTDALKAEYEEEQNILKAEQLTLDNELALLEAQTKAEADKIKQDQEYQTELSRYAKLHDDKKITDEEYQRFKDAAKKKQDELDRVRELQQLQGTLGGLSSVAGAIGEMFGQSKELALVQAGINGAMAVTSILAQYPKFDGGFAMWAAIAAAGITTIAQVGKIASAKPPKSPKFFYGGHTGNNAALGVDEYGPVTGYVHKNEYVIPEVMTQDPQFANTIGWLEHNRQAKLKGFVEGGEASAGVVPGVSQSSSDNAQLLNAVNTLNAILSRGIFAKVNLGYKDVKEIDEMNNEIKSSSQNGLIG